MNTYVSALSSPLNGRDWEYISQIRNIILERPRMSDREIYGNGGYPLFHIPRQEYPSVTFDLVCGLTICTQATNLVANESNGTMTINDSTGVIATVSQTAVMRGGNDRHGSCGTINTDNQRIRQIILDAAANGQIRPNPVPRWAEEGGVIRDEGQEGYSVRYGESPVASFIRGREGKN